MASIHGKIAIVGMACRFPGGAHSPEEFWQLLLSGKNTMEDVPSSRFKIEDYWSDRPGVPNKMVARKGHFLQEGTLFDEAFFNLSPREAMNSDPQHRILLETVVDALDDAGYKESRDGGERGWNKSKMGVFIGSATDSYQNNLASQPIDAFFCPGTIRGFAGGRISHYFGWQGPSVVYDTACSSSLVAVHSACQSLLLHESNAAVAGAANMLTSPEMFLGLSKGFFISNTGGCRTFDESADGYCRAEGVGVVVLKRFEDALRDNDKIDAVIVASGINQSGPSESLTMPHSATQAMLFTSNCERAGISPLAVRVVEAHGTGTFVGDYAEMEAIKATYCQGRKSQSDSQLFVGSLKPNVGHSESAAGMASLIKSVLMMKYRQVVPHIGITTRLSPRLGDLEISGIMIPTSLLPLKPVAGEKHIFTAVHNFGAHGGNSGIILQEMLPPMDSIDQSTSDPRSSHIIVLSAKPHTPFTIVIGQLLQYIETAGPISLSSLSYTTTARRQDYTSRIAFSVTSIKDLKGQLQTYPSPIILPRRNSAPKVGFVIGGNGSQFQGMGKDLYNTSPVFKSYIDACDIAAMEAGVGGLTGLINGCIDPLLNNSISKLAGAIGIFSVGYAVGMMWRHWGLEPSLLLGHSLGEYVALALSGCISLADSMKVLVAKVHAAETSTHSEDGGMLAVGISANDAREMIALSGCSGIDIACINGTFQTVVAGTSSELQRLQDFIRALPAPPLVNRLPGSIAWHSAHLIESANALQKVTNLIPFREAEVPILLNVNGTLLEKGATLSSRYLSQQMVSTVRFDLCVTHPLAQNIDIWIELSAKAILLPFLRPFVPTKTMLLPTLGGPTSNCWNSITKSLARLYEAHIPIKWANYHDSYPVQLVSLPSYPFTRKEHWIVYSDRLSPHTRSENIASSQKQLTPHSSPTYLEPDLPIAQHQTVMSAINPPDVLSVTQILSQELNVPEYSIKVDDLIEDVGVDSIMWLLLRDGIYSQRHCTCPWPEWRKGRTVQELCNLTEMHFQGACKS
ncbi:thiolase-like protein [Lentinula edodes]|nr:thiolase-like protein [Lentinula edodes]